MGAGPFSPTDSPISFGEWLRKQRRMLDLTQAELADRVSCARVTIRKLEAEELRPSKQLAEALAQHLAIPPAEREAFVRFARTGSGPRPHLAEPPPQAFPSSISGLPLLVEDLIGREQDIAAVQSWLDPARPRARLATLTGPGGVGKTSLALAAAADLGGKFEHGVAWIDLTPLRDPQLVPVTTAQVLGLQERGGQACAEVVKRFLHTRRMLLVFDNFEQVVSAAPFISDVLANCADVSILVTSREPLRVRGEKQYSVDPLASDSAIDLFVARVRDVNPAFALTPENSSVVTRICARLDNLPLALELAAAQLRAITPQELLARLDHDIPSISARRRDAHDRQQSLHAAIGWSYNLLDPPLQKLFRELSVFVGGWNLEAGQSICSMGQPILAPLSDLIDKSLVIAEPRASAMRYRYLETIREFALAQMDPEERQQIHRRHAEYFNLALGRIPRDQPTSLYVQTVSADIDNYRAAVRSAIETRQPTLALSLIRGLMWFWETQGYPREGLQLARAALALEGDVDPHLRKDVLFNAATTAWQSHELDIALELAQQAIVLARAEGDERLAEQLNLVGRIYIERADYKTAESVLVEAIDLTRRYPHLLKEGVPAAQLGEVFLARGDLEKARAYSERAVAQLSDEAESVFVALAWTDLAEVALARGEREPAEQMLRNALPHARIHIRRTRLLLVALSGIRIGAPGESLDPAREAARLLGAVAGLGERAGDPLSPFAQSLIQYRTAAAQRRLSRDEWQKAWAEGQAWTLERALDQAQSILETTNK